ncbi:MAG: serine hydrolase [Alphaproteobacteria bacterium]|nr:serine hydrolase [Alphaproteobacteria bacterium]MBV9063978.1 serine hydrolase [Alphaproteobacteria bacterium]
MKTICAAAILLLFGGGAGATDYFPPRGDRWATRTPSEEGIDAVKLRAAIDFAVAHEAKLSPELDGVIDQRDQRITIPLQFAKEPFSSPIGPLTPHAPANGLIVRHGYIVAEWGDTHAVDMTHSVTKTFLSSVAGVAFDRHMIRDVHDRVLDYVHPSPDFELPHNRPITWDQMLRQTSGWIGTMWGKPWWADRPGEHPWTELAAGPPAVGQQWKYSDVRVNALALALTYLWRQPLPEVLKQYVMDPIGASNTWHWENYDNAWVTIDGRRIPVPPGGGHWGGGMFISARDLARMGLLGLHNGRWGDKQIFSEQWVKMAKTPTPQNPEYGFMNWFLNTGRKLLPAAREDAVMFLGNGDNIVFIDYQHDLVAVVRWLDDSRKAEFVRLLEAALAR